MYRILFNTFVRPIFKYASPNWSLHLKHDITLIKRVQNHFTKCLRGHHNKLYTEQLAILNQSSLQLRYLRNDLIFLYKILHSLFNATLKSLFTLSADEVVSDRFLRGHALKLLKPKPCTAMLKYKYFCHVVE